MFLFKWFISSAVIYYFSRNVAVSVVGGLLICVVDSLVFGDSHHITVTTQ